MPEKNKLPEHEFKRHRHILDLGYKAVRSAVIKVKNVWRQRANQNISVKKAREIDIKFLFQQLSAN